MLLMGLFGALVAYELTLNCDLGAWGRSIMWRWPLTGFLLGVALGHAVYGHAAQLLSHAGALPAP